ncbi:MAG: hypothetical protein AAF518_10820 [Spirochaetota bacterium]
MAIPKKRKKLDPSQKTTESKEKQTASKPTDEKVEAAAQEKPVKKAPRPRKKHTESDVDKAFEVMEKLEKEKEKGKVEPEPRQLQLVRKVYSKEEAGLHISFTIDAFQLQDILKENKKEGEPVQDYLEFDVTIPYPWNLPLVNDFTKVVVTKLKELNILK